MITLYTAPTGNGQRASIMLEETGLDYEVHRVNFAEGEHRQPAFLAVNPIGKIPAIVDHDGPGGTFAVVESLAILLYLAEKSGKLLPQDAGGRSKALQWGVALAAGPSATFTSMFHARQLGEDQHAPFLDKCREEAARYFAAMDEALGRGPYLTGDTFCYVDILGFTLALKTAPVFNFSLDPYPSVVRWRDQIAARPAVVAGLKVPA